MKLKTVVHPYMGYCNGSRIYLKGRVYKSRVNVDENEYSFFNNLLNSIFRFGTIELCNKVVEISFAGNTLTCQTDKEGYFEIDDTLKKPLSAQENEWLKAELEVHLGAERLLSEVHVRHHRPSDELIIISDIDDTIMQSFVSSLFKVKMMYYTFTKSPFQRKPIKQMDRLMNRLMDEVYQKRSLFYVSNSPWNIYDFLTRFLDIYHFPKGPLFLRDYGRQMLFRNSNDPIHKLVTIKRLLEFFPENKVLLFGDSAENDVYYYLQMADSFPDRIRGIFIHDIGKRKHKQQIYRLIQERSDVNIVLSEDISAFEKECERMGLI